MLPPKPYRTRNPVWWAMKAYIGIFLDLLVGRLAGAVAGPGLDPDEVRIAVWVGVLEGCDI
jgi:hypothetical protein